VRPGVSQHSEEYVRRRHGAEFEYWDPSVSPALKETYGLPLYQEQIMAIFQLLGGYSAGEADTVRRIMAKYYRIKGGVAAQMLGEYEERFVENAASVCHGGKAIADQIWNYCGRSSEYLFNAAHAKGYSLTAYCDAWLKAHYPDAFYASLLTFPPAWVKKPENRNSFYERNVREARSFGITIKPPDIHESDSNFTIHGDSVRFGFSGIKGLGPAMVADILNNRPFDSLKDMAERLTACNVAGRQALGAAGALDRFGAREELSLDQRAEEEEKRIGVALSGEDRMASIRDRLRPKFFTQDEFEQAPNGQALIVGGEITYGKEIETSTGDPSLKLTIVFEANEYPVSFAPWDYTDQVREVIASDEPVIVQGHKDSEWECVQAKEIKMASEVLDMMTAAQ
jgi:DNA polymerase-3 subunit alpha